MADDKITSIAELKREVKKLHNRNQRYATEPFEHEIIDAIAEFEASVKEGLGSPSPPTITEYTKNDAYANGYFNALRRILGGEG